VRAVRLHGFTFRALLLALRVAGINGGATELSLRGNCGRGRCHFLAVFLHGALGFIGGAIGALLYNLLAKWVGGFEVEVELRATTPVVPYPIIPPATPSI
jgi:hypothetical protein